MMLASSSGGSWRKRLKRMKTTGTTESKNPVRNTTTGTASSKSISPQSAKIANSLLLGTTLPHELLGSYCAVQTLYFRSAFSINKIGLKTSLLCQNCLHVAMKFSERCDIKELGVLESKHPNSNTYLLLRASQLTPLSSQVYLKRS